MPVLFDSLKIYSKDLELVIQLKKKAWARTGVG